MTGTYDVRIGRDVEPLDDFVAAVAGRNLNGAARIARLHHRWRGMFKFTGRQQHRNAAAGFAAAIWVDYDLDTHPACPAQFREVRAATDAVQLLRRRVPADTVRALCDMVADGRCSWVDAVDACSLQRGHICALDVVDAAIADNVVSGLAHAVRAAHRYADDHQAVRAGMGLAAAGQYTPLAVAVAFPAAGPEVI